MEREDEFGAIHSQAFAITDRQLSPAEIETAAITARHHHSQLVIVGSTSPGIPSVGWDRFTNLFGGPIHSTSPLETTFGAQLIELGHNRLPVGLTGNADTLFEVHAHSALEFILAGRVIRYGQDRLFEARPDGIALPHDSFRALYDAKAYADGYPVTQDSIRQFKSYVDDFVARYEPYLSRLNSFIVISGKFAQGDSALRERHQEFIAAAGIPLSFMTASSLAAVISLLTAHPAVRRSLNWARIFAAPIVEPSRVEVEIRAVRRDGLVIGGR